MSSSEETWTSRPLDDPNRPNSIILRIHPPRGSQARDQGLGSQSRAPQTPGRGLEKYFNNPITDNDSDSNNNSSIYGQHTRSSQSALASEYAGDGRSSITSPTARRASSSSSTDEGERSPVRSDSDDDADSDYNGPRIYNVDELPRQTFAAIQSGRDYQRNADKDEIIQRAKEAKRLWYGSKYARVINNPLKGSDVADDRKARAKEIIKKGVCMSMQGGTAGDRARIGQCRDILKPYNYTNLVVYNNLLNPTVVSSVTELTDYIKQQTVGVVAHYVLIIISTLYGTLIGTPDKSDVNHKMVNTATIRLASLVAEWRARRGDERDYEIVLNNQYNASRPTLLRYMVPTRDTPDMKLNSYYANVLQLCDEFQMLHAADVPPALNAQMAMIIIDKIMEINNKIRPPVTILAFVPNKRASRRLRYYIEMRGLADAPKDYKVYQSSPAGTKYF